MAKTLVARGSHCLAVCALSPHPDNNYLAYPMRKQEQPIHPGFPTHVPPGSQKTSETMGGDVMLFDTNEMQEIKVIPAHQAPLSCIAMNNEGTLLATASEKGTIIRVFAIPSAQKLYQFRRGSMPSRIQCMSFNATSTLLCVSSSSDTIHIFKLAPQTAAKEDGSGSPLDQEPNSPTEQSHQGRLGSSSPTASTDQDASMNLDVSNNGLPSAPRPKIPGFMSLMRRTSQNVSTSLVSRAAGYLPTTVTEIWEPARDFAWVKLPKSRSGQTVKSVVAMAGSAPQIMVATSEGDFLVYNIDLERGAEGTLVRQYSYV